MEAAIKALEGKRLGTAIDFATVGKDAQLRHPNPHAETTIYSMYLRGDGNLYTIEGLGGPSERLATPILNAADKCERVRKNAG